MRGRLLLLTLTVAGSISLTSREQVAPHSSQHSVDCQKQLDILNAHAAALEKDVNLLKSTVDYYKYLIDMKQTRQDSIMLDVASHGYQRLDTDNGSFLVSLKDASPYLNGYKLTINIGNPSAAKFSGITMTVKWAKKYSGKFEGSTYQDWIKSIQTKSIEITTVLHPADWNPVEVMLIPASSDQLGYLELSLQASTVELHTTPASQ